MWHGNVQTFGPGNPQVWANVLGRVSSRVTSLSYRLNGGALIPLDVGPNGTRLAKRGDFNIELDRSTLRRLPDENVVEFTATLSDGEVETEAMTLRYRGDGRPLSGLTIVWKDLDTVSRANEVGTIIDGHFALDPFGIRTVEAGYDRLLAIGDAGWSSRLEVLAEAILHRWSGSAGVGVAFGWQGHGGTARPRIDWPLEGLAWIRNVGTTPKLRILTFQQGASTGPEIDLRPPVTIALRARSEPLGDGSARLLVKLWTSDEGEPAEWMHERTVPERSGSVLLVTHLAEVTWTRVSVTPL